MYCIRGSPQGPASPTGWAKPWIVQSALAVASAMIASHPAGSGTTDWGDPKVPTAPAGPAVADRPATTRPAAATTPPSRAGRRDLIITPPQRWGQVHTETFEWGPRLLPERAHLRPAGDPSEIAAG